MSYEELEHSGIKIAETELPLSSFRLSLVPLTPRMQRRIQIALLLGLQFLIAINIPGPHQHLLFNLVGEHKPNPWLGSLVFVPATALCVAAIFKKRPTNLCPACESVTSFPHWIRFTYCPTCRRLAEPSRVLLSSTGTLDLDNPAYLNGPEAIPKMIAFLYWRCLAQNVTELCFESGADGMFIYSSTGDRRSNGKTLDLDLQKPVCQALKAMAALDLDCSQQEGSLLIKHDGRETVTKISVEPTPHGERLIARFPGNQVVTDRDA